MSDLPKGVAPGVRELLEITYNRDVKSRVGDFAGVIQFNNSNLVVSADGVGTKLMLACEVANDTGDMSVHEGIGEDLVNHCVNDILVTGAKPLFFANTFSYGDDRAAPIQEYVTRGMARAATMVNMPLLTGETSKMEGFYPYPLRSYDVVGTIVGHVPDSLRIDGSRVKPGDKLIGLASSGLHTNGFTLLRTIFGPEEKANQRFWKECPELGAGVRQVALTPHRCYSHVVAPILDKYTVSAMAHVTGGGILKNLKRVCKPHTPEIHWKGWQWPKVFEFIMECGRCKEHYMQETFNLGVGFVLVVPPHFYKQITALLELLHEKPILIGEVV